VAATNGRDHVRELYDLVGREPPATTFNAENGAESLGRHFSRVDRIDVHGWFVFPDAAAAQSYVDSMVVLSGTVPAVEGPIRARRTPCVFVADK
jgi:hypothetical protein